MGYHQLIFNQVNRSWGTVISFLIMVQGGFFLKKKTNLRERKDKKEQLRGKRKRKERTLSKTRGDREKEREHETEILS